MLKATEKVLMKMSEFSFFQCISGKGLACKKFVAIGNVNLRTKSASCPKQSTFDLEAFKRSLLRRFSIIHHHLVN